MPVQRNIRLLAILNFLIDFRLYAPIVILYFSDVAGSFALGMSIFSVTMLAAALFEVPTGVLSDKVGRKRTVVLGALASTAALVCYALGGSYVMLLAGGICEGLSRAFYSGNNDALLHDTLTQLGQPERYQEVLGKTASMYQLALGISAVIGGAVATISLSAVVWLSVIPQALSVVVSLLFVEPAAYEKVDTNVYAHLRTSFRNIARNPRLRLLTLASALSFAQGESAFQFRPVFVASLWPLWALGLMRTVSHILAASSFYSAGRLIRRFGEFRLLVGGMTISESMNLAGLLMANVVSPGLMAINSVFFGVNTVAVNGLMQREFTPEQRATMGSLSSFAGSLIFAVVSLLLGALADAVGATQALIVATVFGAVPISLFALAFRRRGQVALANEAP